MKEIFSPLFLRFQTPSAEYHSYNLFQEGFTVFSYTLICVASQKALQQNQSLYIVPTAHGKCNHTSY